MNRYLVGSTYERFCIKFPQCRMKIENKDSILPTKHAKFQNLGPLFKQNIEIFFNNPFRWSFAVFWKNDDLYGLLMNLKCFAILFRKGV
jgi:hypothetical protein